jgi:hypothetical protein
VLGEPAVFRVAWVVWTKRSFSFPKSAADPVGLPGDVLRRRHVGVDRPVTWGVQGI